nr:ABC-three component system middle component 2 [uncultured Cohaesibacter sp.]
MIDASVLTFNGPLEAGIRAVAVLGCIYPESFDIQRLTAYDYLLIRTSILGGPEDLHPNTPIQTPATAVRRKVVQDALHLMMTRDLVERVIRNDGISYCAGDSAMFFLESLTTPYISAMKKRAKWLTSTLSTYSDDDFNSLMQNFFDQWVIEFHDVEIERGDA